MKKILIALAGLVVLGFVALVTVIGLAGRDIPPPDTTDLTVTRPEVAPENNAYTYILAATNFLYWPTNISAVTNYLDGKPPDEAVIQEVITRNTTTLQTIRRALNCRIFLAPEVTTFDQRLPPINSWLKMGKVIAVKARQDRLAGRYKEAINTCITLLQFGDIIQKDAENIIIYMVGSAVLNLGLAQAQDIACDRAVPPEELTRLSGTLANLGPFDRGLIRAVKGEYRIVANTIDRFQNGEFGPYDISMIDDKISKTSVFAWKICRFTGFFFQANKTKLDFANNYRTMIKNTTLPYAKINILDAHLRQELDVGDIIMRPNAAGRLLYILMIPAFDSLHEQKCRVECGVATTRLLIACNIYQKKQGKLLADLQALVPDYLAAIPNDPFDGKPFRYLPSKGIIYSVGKDLKDSGGSTNLLKGSETCAQNQRRWEAEDVVFEINGGAGQGK